MIPKQVTRQYGVIPTLDIPRLVLYNYWKALEEANLLWLRLCDVENPTVEDVLQMVENIGAQMYNVYDPDTEKLVADFALTNFTGKAAQVHFSMHPDNSPQYSMHLARTVTDDILDIWGELENPDTPYLYSLYGLTPVPNRAACAFVRRVGFKRIGTLPMGHHFDGKPVDAMLSLKVRKDNGR